jgi:hypothetical protein
MIFKYALKIGVKTMFTKSYTSWLRRIPVISLMSLSFVMPAFADYIQWSQATIDDMTSTTIFHAPDDTSDDRTIIGIGEQVVCSIDPYTWEDLDCEVGVGPVQDTIGNRVWYCWSAGTISPNGTNRYDETTLTAGMSPDYCMVEVDVYDEDNPTQYRDAAICKQINFQVIAPESIDVTCTNTYDMGIMGFSNIGADSEFAVTVYPISVCFANVDFQAAIPYTPWQWPDTTQDFYSQNDIPWNVGQDNTFVGGASWGLDPIGRIYNGNGYVDFDITWSYWLKYLDDSYFWAGFDNTSTVARYQGSTQKARMELDSASGQYRGPWM